jgi:hypothetical protein
VTQRRWLAPQIIAADHAPPGVAEAALTGRLPPLDREDLLCMDPPNRAAGRWRSGDEQPPGARRGANKRQYRAITGDVERLKLLAGPHPATSGYGLDLHGMQEVWGIKSP